MVVVTRHENLNLCLMKAVGLYRQFTVVLTIVQKCDFNHNAEMNIVMR